MMRFAKGSAVFLTSFLLAALAVVPAQAALASKLVPASAFRPISNYDPSDVEWGFIGLSISNNSSSSRDAWFTAPVVVPVGAVITKLAFITSNPSGGTSQATLFRAKSWGTDLPLEVARVSTSIASSNYVEYVVDATSTKMLSGDMLWVSLRLAPYTNVRAVKVFYKKP